MTRLAKMAVQTFRYAYLVAVAVFLMAPIIVIVLVSFSPSPVFEFSTTNVSLQWYKKLGEMTEFWSAVTLSIEIGGITAAISLILGTLCALGIVRGQFPGRNAVLIFVLSPMMLPGVVIGIAMLFAFRNAGLQDGFTSLILGHIVITLPYVVRVLYGGLSLFNFEMIEAARTLGYSHGKALLYVLVPGIFPSFLTAGMFAFLASVDNYALALFLGDVRNVTLPIQILKYLERSADPSVAAIASIMILLTVVIVVFAERLVGTRRLVGG